MTNPRSQIIKYGRIVLDKRTAYLKPLLSEHTIDCGDKNGHYSIPIDYLNAKYTATAWDELYKKIYIFNDTD